jgi:hypothetical protein
MEDGVEQVHPIALFGVAVLEPIDELAARIPDRGGAEVEQVLAFIIDRLECAVVGQPGDIDALGELRLVGVLSPNPRNF